MSCLESESRLAILHMPAARTRHHAAPEGEASILGVSMILAMAFALSLAITMARLA
ncbi:MAG: hypothetical protein AB7E47_12695 [Desulfovibrionaceae bacterium]